MPVIPGEILTYKFSYSFFLSFFLSSFYFPHSAFVALHSLFVTGYLMTLSIAQITKYLMTTGLATKIK